MDYIIRPKYIEKIKQFIDKPIIKILTGMRRVGKSTLLLIIKDDILKNIPNENKIYINFEFVVDIPTSIPISILSLLTFLILIIPMLY